MAAGSFFRLIRRRPTLPGGLPPSTIGDDELNYRVRNGNGCDFVSMATETLTPTALHKRGEPGVVISETFNNSISEHEQKENIKPSAD
jgi:hypothetical protein